MGNTFQDYQSIANIFNTYFTNITDKMPVNNSVTMNLVLNYLYKVFIRPFPHIILTPVTTKEISLLLPLHFRLCLFFQRLGQGSFDETFFPSFLRPASTSPSLWTTISRDLCQTVVLHSPHMGIPLSSSILDPFNYVLNAT